MTYSPHIVVETPTADPALAFFSNNQRTAAESLNDWLLVIGATSQLSVIDSTLTAPPGGESDGDRYIPAATATGDWAGQENNVALFFNSVYYFVTPQVGWIAWDVQAKGYRRFNGTSWVPFAVTLHTFICAGVVWAAMGAGPTEFRGVTENRKIIDLRGFTQIRVSSSCMGSTLGPASSTIRFQYSIDSGSTWDYFDSDGADSGPSVAIDAAGCQSGAWVDIDAAAKTATTQVRMVGVGGTGTTPRFSMMEIELR